MVRLQEIVAPVLRARGKKVRVWKIDEARRLIHALTLTLSQRARES